MLVLTRRTNESIMIGDDVRIVVLDVRGDVVRVGIEAPRSVQVHRAEVYAEVVAQAQGENVEGATPSPSIGRSAQRSGIRPSVVAQRNPAGRGGSRPAAGVSTQASGSAGQEASARPDAIARPSASARPGAVGQSASSTAPSPGGYRVPRPSAPVDSVDVAALERAKSAAAAAARRG